MAIADTKKVQSLIQGVLDALTAIESGIEKLNTIKTKYQAHNPSLAGSNLTVQQLSAFNSYLNDTNQAQTDHAGIINTLKSKDVPSHSTSTLD